MKHTSFIPMDSCSQGGRNPNVLKSPPDSGGSFKWRLLLRCLGLVLVLFTFSTSLSAQKVLTGSGSTSCNGTFNFGNFGSGTFYEDDATLGKREFIVCPDAGSQNSHLTKIGVTGFDVAPGDTLTIYEGCGTSGTPLAGFPYYGGGASAATSLPSSWFLAQCEGDGCLTLAFAPNGDNNKGTGIAFEFSCEPRMATITCPSDAVEAAFCDATTGTISGNHTVQGLSGTCNVSPTIMAATLFTGSVDNTIQTATGTATTIGATENLAPGNYFIRIEYVDVPGGTTADPNDTCSYNIVVDSGITPVCNDRVNVSLSGGCEAVITVDNILEGNHECVNDFIVQLLDGENADTNIVNASYIGTTARVQVVEPTSGNRCWGYVTVEDKLAPVLTCADMSIYCSTTTDPEVIGGYPTTADICSGSVSYTFTDAETSFSCKAGEVLTVDGDGNPLTVAPDTIGLVVRTWTAVDGNGNLSFPCTQNIHILKPQLVASDIIWPSDTTLYCGDNPTTSPAETGSPLVQVGDEMISLDQTCFFGLSHQDQVFTADCEGSRKILRTWTILDWCHPGTVYTNAATAGSTQIIELVDTIGPVITDVPFFNDITITNAGHECGVSLEIPPVTVSDACSNVGNITVRVVGPSNTIFNNGGMMSNIPFGTHSIIYIAEDDCGNTSSDTVSITVNDAVSPTVICEENISVSLTQDGTAWAFANTFDDGSHDNCGIDSMRVRRMDSCAGTAFPTANQWSTSVPFECCDIGGTVLVSLGVWDKSGNFNNCMVNVRVVDKVQPTIVCPSDLTIDCTADTRDLSVFGNATLSGGNCNTASLGVAAVTRNVNNCGAGTIVRTWTLGNATCSQTITLELSPTEDIRVDEIPAEIIVSCNNVDLSIYDDGSDLNFTAVGCQTIAVNYNRTDFVGETGSCRKIVRDWELIDWCINPNALVDADGDGYKGPGYKKVTQVVRVMDSEGPVIYSNNAPVGNGPLVFNDFSVGQSTCQAAEVVLPSFQALDNCSEEVLPVRVSGTIGSHVLVDAEPRTLRNIPVGTYTLLYSAEDGCGNRSVVEVQIVITDNAGPAMFCIDEIAVNLGVSNVAGQGGGAIDVWASDFACKVEDCNALGALVMAYPANNTGVYGATPPPHADSSAIFTCVDLGTKNVDIWARDVVGNWSVVTVLITVQDNSNLCNPTTTPNPNPNPNPNPCSVSFSATGGAGMIDVTMATGDLPYTISWRGPTNGDGQLTSGNTFNISSLAAGTYTVFVVDINGCSASQQVVVSGAPVIPQPCDVAFTAAGGAGTIDLTMVTGNSPYSISWRGPMDGDAQLTSGNTFNVSSLPAGTYTVFVTNANCSTSQTVVVTPAQPLCDVTFAATGGPGMINITMATGSLPYTISWRGPVDGDAQLTSGNTFAIPSLPAGNYTVFVTNANCSTSQTVVVTSGQPVCDVTFAVTGGAGTIDITMATGDLPYSISWRGPVDGDAQLTSGNTFNVGSLPAGTYTVFVTNRNCSTAQTVTVTQAQPVCDVTFTATGGTGMINITMATGSLPYTISWRGPRDGDAQLASGNTFAIPSLPAGTYTVFVTNANCSSSRTVVVSAPPVCDVTFTATGGAGMIDITMTTGSSPYTISWRGPVDGDTQLTSGNSFNIGSLPAGTYTVFVTNLNCSFSQTVVVGSTGTSCPVAFTSTVGNGIINVRVTSGSGPYTYSWDGPTMGMIQLASNTYDITGLPTGVYNITVMDAANCVSTTMLMITNNTDDRCIDSPTTFVASGASGSAVVTVSAGLAPYTYAWDGAVTGYFRTSSNTYTVPGLSAGTYTILVTDARGCFDIQVISVVDACAAQGGDADNDGVCAADDCNDNDPSIGAGQQAGTACNDGDDNTTNDVIQSDGCTCAGEAAGGPGDDGEPDDEGGDQAAIRGTILDETGASVQNVVVNLGGYNMNPTVTGASGNYQFNAVPMYSNYTVTPEKNMNPLNGVSTFDLVLISKHILGIDLLDSPYKHIAADVNKSGTITAFDMVQLRQLILNISANFPNNDSWRFIDANYQFATNAPENESFAEIATISDLSSNMDAHFVAVKIGDVSGNAAPNTLASSEARSFNSAVTFNMKDQRFERGELIEVAFNLENIEQVLGYQFTLDIDPTVAKIVELKEGLATEANFGLMNVERGQLTTSWNQNHDVNTAGSMFTLVLRANQAGRLSEIIQLNSELTAKEAYSDAGQLLDVTLDFSAMDKAFKLYQNTPNPFKDVTTISFDLPEATTVQLTIFDVSGKLMKSINGEFNKGYNEVQINKSELAENGIYFYNLETAGHVAKKRMILID